MRLTWFKTRDEAELRLIDIGNATLLRRTRHGAPSNSA
jgi:hypothetical protein